ncbi:hypothetical protein A1O3_02834 [Capronia epimyces CBS 606.96]|uniref:Uncharacterized protein n=1 Tax=Capronia epimyces CBS 606.96 TaxID=1182542 RepID=W9YA87_9EURO|nr:uncharacterized protein A1O3_02834 [Capronia epimyces CBS 606.96]EXJ89767.1 hypothetical protein A1O3_02834 [Capronia epimyces CBS 606.96]
MDWRLLPILLLAAPSAIPPTHIYTALNGRPRYLDSFLFCLGMQTPLSPNTLNAGEYPACAALTNGHVFRVENQATVMYLQRLARTGHLLTLEVGYGSPQRENRPLVYAPASALLSSLIFHGTIDPYVLITILILLSSRLLSIASLRARTAPSWHGASEPGVQGDLLVLLAEDGWIRLKGAVDDLKAVTSGSWLSRRPHNPRLADAMDWTARLLVYFSIVVLANASDQGKMGLAVSILLGHASLALVNARTEQLAMNDRIIKVSQLPGSVKKYSRRLEMAEDLVKEVGRSDFAVRLGIIKPDTDRQGQGAPDNEVVTM